MFIENKNYNFSILVSGLIFFVTWAQTPDYTAAFTNLNADDGAAILEYLTENSIPYQITNNGQTIRVPSRSSS